MQKTMRRSEDGQILAIFAGGIVALLLGAALVIDGGNAMAQQRATQASTDAAAEAGTVVIAQYLMGGSAATGATGTCPNSTASDWDRETCRAVYGSAAANGVTVKTAQYTDYKGDVVGTVGGGSFPNGSQGVKVIAETPFDTYIVGMIGMSQWTATTQATAVTGTTTTLCQPGQPCGLFPITVPYVTSTCDNSGKLTPGQGDWPYLGDADTIPANEAIVPLCKDQNDDIGGGSAGSVGWLDYSTAIGGITTGTCPNTFKGAVLTPCIASVPFPTWIQTFTGGVGKGGGGIEEALNDYHGDTVQIPLFDGTCKSKPTGPGLVDCPAGDIGVGSNTWYHIPSFASFKVDYFYVAGGSRKECDKAPGSPFVSGNGSNGCLKGWWVVALPSPGAVGLGTVTPSTSNRLGIQLIR